MAAPDIPTAKRRGLPVDLERLASEGDSWLSPEERYALKTHGVCAQAQDHVFMVRVRIPGGTLLSSQARGLARLGRSYASDWLHLTTRQNVELHWVEDRRAPALLDEVELLGLTNRSACGHTMRNVMASEDAGLGLDEPFDCLPDARAVSDALLARSAELDCTLPSRINIAFGGSPRCVADARLNDAGFVSIVRDGALGYELWAGGSLGKAPAPAIRLSEWIARDDVLAAAEALVDVFRDHGDVETPSKGRMKFVVAKLGADAFRAVWDQAFAAARSRPHPPTPPVEVLDEPDRVAILTEAPEGGWSVGVRPQRRPGRALLTVDLPLGDTCGAELELLADLADRWGDGALVLSRDQDVVLRDVAVEAVPIVRAALAGRGLWLAGEAPRPTVRACTGAAVCALGITAAPDLGRDLLDHPALTRNPSLRLHVSGCPNSCAQHQAADVGLAGGKVRVDGVTTDGYQLYLGWDPSTGDLGEVVGRVPVRHVASAVSAVVGVWEAVRHDGEPIGRTARRIGLDAVAAHVGTVLTHWSPGPEPDLQPTTT